jgi:hypothetical protein
MSRLMFPIQPVLSSLEVNRVLSCAKYVDPDALP